MDFIKEGFSFDPHAKFLLRRNGRQVGNVVKNHKGYEKDYVRLTWSREGKRKSAYAHRIIWELHYGKIPDGYCIDHINGDGLDNRIENLRLATKSQNGQNRKNNKNKKDGLPKGVIINHGKYTGRVYVNGKRLQKISSDLDEIVNWLENKRKENHGVFMNNGEQ